MSLIKPLERLRRMHNLIKFRRTGPPEAFAQRLGISQSMLFRLLNELKELGAPIHYCHIHLSYTYYDSVELQLGFVSVPEMTPVPRPPKAAGGQIIPLRSARPTQCHTAGVAQVCPKSPIHFRRIYARPDLCIPRHPVGASGPAPQIPDISQTF